MRLSDLKVIVDKSVKLAGPRYSPGVDPNAPNLEMRELTETFNALALSDQFRATLLSLRTELSSTRTAKRVIHDTTFSGRTVTLDSLLRDLDALGGSGPGWRGSGTAKDATTRTHRPGHCGTRAG